MINYILLSTKLSGDPLHDLGKLINDIQSGEVQESDLDAAAIVLLDEGVQVTTWEEVYETNESGS